MLDGAVAGAYCLRQPQTVRIVGKAHGGVGVCCADACQPPPVHPGHYGAIVPFRLVADRVIFLLTYAGGQRPNLCPPVRAHINWLNINHFISFSSHLKSFDEQLRFIMIKKAK